MFRAALFTIAKYENNQMSSCEWVDEDPTYKERGILCSPKLGKKFCHFLQPGWTGGHCEINTKMKWNEKVDTTGHHVYLELLLKFQFSSVWSLSRVWLFVTPWIAARQASLSITNSQSLLKLVSIESVMPPNHLILCHPLLLLPSVFPRIRAFPMSQFFASGGQSTGVSALASFFPKNNQGWSPSEWTGWISLQSKGLSRVFSNTTFKSNNSLALSLLHSPTLTSIHDRRKNHSLG